MKVDPQSVGTIVSRQHVRRREVPSIRCCRCRFCSWHDCNDVRHLAFTRSAHAQVYNKVIITRLPVPEAVRTVKLASLVLVLIAVFVANWPARSVTSIHQCHVGRAGPNEPTFSVLRDGCCPKTSAAETFRWLLNHRRYGCNTAPAAY